MTHHMDPPFEEALDRCLARVLAGEPLDAVLLDYSDMDEALRPLLTHAAALIAVSVPAPSTDGRAAAISRMLAASRDAAEHYQPAGVLAGLGSLRARPLAFQAIAAAIALAVLGSAGLGASAATGTTPEPIRTFFHLPGTSDSSVRAHGSVVSASADALVIDDNGTKVAFLLDTNTAVRRAGGHVDWTNLHTGESVDVRATRRANGDLAAHEVRAIATPTPTASEGGASSTSATPPVKIPEANRTEHPEDRPGNGTPTPQDEHTAVSGEDATPRPDATVTPYREDGDGPGPPATATPKTAETREPTEGAKTPSSGGGDSTPTPTR